MVRQQEIEGSSRSCIFSHVRSKAEKPQFTQSLDQYMFPASWRRQQPLPDSLVTRQCPNHHLLLQLPSTMRLDHRSCCAYLFTACISTLSSFLIDGPTTSNISAWTLISLITILSLASSQQVGTYNKEIHPRFSWTKCTPDNSCQPVDGALTIDAKWRWLHRSDGYKDCFWQNEWNTMACNSEANCTEACVIEGSDYRPNNWIGASFGNNSVTLALRTWKDFNTNIGSRFFLLSPGGSEALTKYQTFTLLNNEFAFDVNFSTVGCGINGALTFVEMDADGGMARSPTNKAGAAYGTGYCDSKCHWDQSSWEGRQISKGGSRRRRTLIPVWVSTGRVARNLHYGALTRTRTPCRRIFVGARVYCVQGRRWMRCLWQPGQFQASESGVRSVWMQLQPVSNG